jgi:DNA (cytosine-5)-methyltransferase 1
VQSWKNPRRPWGRYAQQYWYRCPACTEITWPLVYPAASAIDWTLDAPRIGDRARPLAANTRARIQAGLRRYATQPAPMLVRVAGHTYQRDGSTCRVRPVDEPFPVQTGTLADALVVPSGGTWNEDARPVTAPAPTQTAREAWGLLVSYRGTDQLAANPRLQDVADPMPTQGASKTMALLVPTEARDGLRARPAGEPLRTQTTRAELGLAVLPFVTELYGTNRAGRPLHDPLGTVTALGNHHYLTLPPGFVVANYGNGSTKPGKNGWMRGPHQPLGTVTTRDHHALLVPYYRTGQARRPSEPLRAVTTHDRDALVELAERVEDCGFRMLQPGEIQAAMAFRVGYQVLGNKREQVAQLGNAVTPPVMRLLMARVLESLAA